MKRTLQMPAQPTWFSFWGWFAETCIHGDEESWLEGTIDGDSFPGCLVTHSHLPYLFCIIWCWNCKV
jgi:hypothetical protein